MAERCRADAQEGAEPAGSAPSLFRPSPSRDLSGPVGGYFIVMMLVALLPVARAMIELLATVRLLP